jgi:hypothetical protein
MTLGVHDVGDEPADRIVEDRVIVDSEAQDVRDVVMSWSPHHGRDQSVTEMCSVGYIPLDSRRQIVSGPLRSHIELVRALDHLRCELATEFTQPPPNLNSVGHIASIAGCTSRRPSSRPVPATTTGFAGTTNSIGSRRRHTEFRKTIRQPFLRAAALGIKARSDTPVEGWPCDARLTPDKHRGHSRRQRADPA